MFNYIKAEMYRLTHKKGTYIYYGILALIFTAIVLYLNAEVKGFGDTYYSIFTLIIPLVTSFFIGIHVFIGIVMNDLTAKTLPNVLSTSLSRVQFLLGKLIVAFVSIVLVHLVFGFLFIGLGIFVQGGVDGQAGTDIVTAIEVAGVNILGVVGFMLLASIVAYFFQKSSLALVAYIVLSLGIIDGILSQARGLSKYILYVYDHLLGTYLNTASSSALKGALEVNQVVPLVIYLAVATIVAILVLTRIEIKEGE